MSSIANAADELDFFTKPRAETSCTSPKKTPSLPPPLFPVHLQTASLSVFRCSLFLREEKRRRRRAGGGGRLGGQGLQGGGERGGGLTGGEERGVERLKRLPSSRHPPPCPSLQILKQCLLLNFFRFPRFLFGVYFCCVWCLLILLFCFHPSPLTLSS